MTSRDFSLFELQRQGEMKQAYANEAVFYKITQEAIKGLQRIYSDSKSQTVSPKMRGTFNYTTDFSSPRAHRFLSA